MTTGTVVYCRPPRRQAGITLVVALLLLLAMSIIGVTAMNNSTLQERMAGNTADRAVAFQAAEAAVRAGEQVITDANCRPDDNDLYEPGEDEVTDEPAQWDSNNGAIHTHEVSDDTAQDAQYIIEEIEPGGAEPGRGDSDPSVFADSFLLYQITAQGFGRTEDADSVLRVTFRCRL